MHNAYLHVQAYASTESKRCFFFIKRNILSSPPFKSHWREYSCRVLITGRFYAYYDPDITSAGFVEYNLLTLVPEYVPLVSPYRAAEGLPLLHEQLQLHVQVHVANAHMHA